MYRKKWEIHIDRLQREKANGASVQVGINPSKVLFNCMCVLYGDFSVYCFFFCLLSVG